MSWIVYMYFAMDEVNKRVSNKLQKTNYLRSGAGAGK